MQLFSGTLAQVRQFAGADLKRRDHATFLIETVDDVGDE